MIQNLLFYLQVSFEFLRISLMVFSSNERAEQTFGQTQKIYPCEPGCPSRLSLYMIAYCKFSLYFYLKELVTSAGIREEDYVEGQCNICYILSTDGRAFLELSWLPEPEILFFEKELSQQCG